MHIQKERKLLLSLSAVFAVIALVIFGYGMTTRAAESGTVVSWMNEMECPYLLEYTCSETNSFGDARVSTGRVHSTYPIVGWYTNNSKTWLDHAAVDLENKKYYRLDDEEVVRTFYWEYATTSYTDYKTGKTTYPVDEKMCTNKDIVSGHLYLNFDSGTLIYSGMIFEDKKSFENYVNTGSLDGMIKGDDNPPPRDYSTEYDPTVPIPQLKDLSHNGFTVANAADDLELDLVVESYFYGLDHVNTKVGTKNTRFQVDKTDLIAKHLYEPTCFDEIGFTGSKVVLHQEPFDCKNRFDLFTDGIEYFMNYPTHTKLPDYNMFKHSASEYDLIYATYTTKYQATYEDLNNALETSGQAFTKYYVRFYQLKESELTPNTYVMTPGQWYCYTYNTKSNTGVSPVEGNPDNGSPIETDPIWGEQDEDGNPIYDDGSLPDIDTSNPIVMLQDFIDFLVGLPDQLGDISLFLKDAFCFIPEKYWGIILAGVGFMVVFLIFRAIK